MPDTPYSRNDVTVPPDRLPFGARQPDTQAAARLAEEVRQLREELRRLKETMRED